jgi:hypothetical protein
MESHCDEAGVYFEVVDGCALDEVILLAVIGILRARLLIS